MTEHEQWLRKINLRAEWWEHKRRAIMERFRPLGFRAFRQIVEGLADVK